MSDVRKDLHQDEHHRPHAKTLRFVIDRILRTLEHAEPLVLGN